MLESAGLEVGGSAQLRAAQSLPRLRCPLCIRERNADADSIDSLSVIARSCSAWAVRARNRIETACVDDAVFDNYGGKTSVRRALVRAGRAVSGAPVQLTASQPRHLQRMQRSRHHDIPGCFVMISHVHCVILLLLTRRHIRSWPSLFVRGGRAAPTYVAGCRHHHRYIYQRKFQLYVGATLLHLIQVLAHFHRAQVLT